MAPFYLKSLNVDALPSDFFANCSMLGSPRDVFGEINLFIQNAFSLSWYESHHLVQSIIAAIFPFATFLALNRVAAKFVQSSQTPVILLVLVCLPIFVEQIAHYFSVAWWPPFLFQATPHAVALTFGMISLFFAMSTRSIEIFLSLIFLFISTLYHPTVGASIAAVQLCALILLDGQRRLVFVLLTSSCALLTIFLLFHSDANISNGDFVRIYALEAHAPHYVPSRFGRLSSWPWWASFGVVVAIGLVCSITLMAMKNVRAAVFILLLHLFYVSALIVQYVGVEILQIRMIATIGPSRVFLWGYWFCVLGTVLVLSRLNDNQATPNPTAAQMISSAMALVFLAIMSVFFRGDELSSNKDKSDRSLLDWIEYETPTTSVFLAPHRGGLRVAIPVLTNRSNFYGNGFPFNTSCFAEYERRRLLIDGSREQHDRLPGSWSGAKIQRFFEQKGAEEYRQIMRDEKIDYVIVTNQHAKKSFDDFDSSFESDQYSVFHIDDLTSGMSASFESPYRGQDQP